MSSPEGSRGERDAPRTSNPTGQQHLYLIFDDWEWGYSIRKIKLTLRSPHQRSLRPLEQRRLRRPEHKRLPPPSICLEAPRRNPLFFAAVGTEIIAAHTRKYFSASMTPEFFVPIVDGPSMGVRFGPGLWCATSDPILIPVGDNELFALDVNCFSMLSMKPSSCRQAWSWCELPLAPLMSMDVTSFAVGSDGQTIFASTDCATFVFNIPNSEWKQSSNCSLPFIGQAHYVHNLDIFVGLSKGPTYGHLCFRMKLSGDEKVSLSKEKLLFKDPDACYLCAALVYLRGTESGFCLVESLVITEGKSVNKSRERCNELLKSVDEGLGNCDQLKKNVDEGDGASGSMQECGELDQIEKNVDELMKFVDEDKSKSMHDRYFYRLTTFSLSFDNNRDLTTGETCVVQCYKVPKEVSEAIYLQNPVAFWL